MYYSMERPNEDFEINEEGDVRNRATKQNIIPFYSPFTHDIYIALNGKTYSLAELLLSTLEPLEDMLTAYHEDFPDNLTSFDTAQVLFLDNNHANVVQSNLVWQVAVRPKKGQQWCTMLVSSRGTQAKVDIQDAENSLGALNHELLSYYLYI